MEAFVKSEIKNGVGTITFFHPQSNSMPGTQLRNLASEIEKLGKDNNAKVIVLKSEGDKAFCAGASFGKAVGGGVGIASSADYTFATDAASVKLSELAVGIGPFVVGPAVERKVGTSAFCQLTINATEWQTAQWAKEKGLYAELFSSAEEMDKGIETLAGKLATSNPEAMAMLKKVMWKGTENWDELLIERAGMSGTLVLSEFTVNAINKFKQKT